MGDRTRADPLAALAEITEVVGATAGIDEIVEAVLRGLDEGLGFTKSMLMLYDEHASVLFTIASRGYDTEGVGSEVCVGVGLIGMTAARREPARAANIQRLLTYARSVRRSAEDHGAIDLVAEIPLPGLPDPQSQMAVPMLSAGALIGVIAVESAQLLFGYDDVDEQALSIVAGLAAKSIVAERALTRAVEEDESANVPFAAVPGRFGATIDRRSHLRHFATDGSTFLDDSYVIRGVAGRLLWKLAREYVESGRTEFTNREVRLDPDLELPEFRDNFESRLILLKRRLDERNAALRIVSTARGRFRLDVDGSLDLHVREA